MRQAGGRKIGLAALAAALALHFGVWLAVAGDWLRVPTPPPSFSVVEAELVQAVVAPPQPKAEPRPEKPVPHPAKASAPSASAAANDPAKQPPAAPAPSTPSPAPTTETKTAAEPYTEPDYRVAYLNNPAPPYPLAARRRGLTGKVVLRVEVTVEGYCADVTVAQSSGHGLLDETAVEAVRKWRFVPAKRAGRAVAAMVTVPINFKLENGEG